MKYRLKINKSSRSGLPSQVIRETLFEGKTELEFYPNLRMGIVAPAGSDAKTVLGSLEILRHHFEQIAEEKKKMTNPRKNKAFQILSKFVQEEILNKSDEEGEEGGDFEEEVT